LNVVFAPTGIGGAAGSVIISNDAVGSPTTIPLSGIGIQPPHSATIAWAPSASVVFGYNVYRATGQSGPYTRLTAVPLTSTQYTDISVQPGQTYFYWVTAVDANTIESVFSVPVSAIIPIP
jgi:fibronectin type 3 domain-containing protein